MVDMADFDLWTTLSESVDGMVHYFLDHIPEFIFCFIILFVTYIVAALADRWFKNYSKRIQKNMRLDITKFTMFRHVTVGFIYIVGLGLIFYSIPELRALSSTILVSVSIIGLVVGMAAQDTFGNIISGVALTFFQPFRVGDLITTKDIYGRVTDINLRQTTITTSDNRIILIPNSLLNKEVVINWTIKDPSIRWTFIIPVSYDTDIDRTRAVIIEEIRKNPNVLSKEELRRSNQIVSEEIRVRISNFNTYSIDLTVDYWINDRDNAYSTEYAVRESIKKRIDQEPSINIPFPRYVLETAQPIQIPNKNEESENRR
ncbi:MAG: mechanosensitive ion channel family protein [Methanimicrococcus sp.]|nr:mechanosensitive ion channel family protein [Methanimicrococcus sp.]